MIGKFKVAHLCGLTRGREKDFRAAEEYLTKKGFICFRPVFYELDIYEQYKTMIDEMCDAKMDMCDIIVICTPDHIGKQTKQRIKQALESKKEIYVWTGEIVMSVWDIYPPTPEERVRYAGLFY